VDLKPSGNYKTKTREGPGAGTRDHLVPDGRTWGSRTESVVGGWKPRGEGKPGKKNWEKGQPKTKNKFRQKGEHLRRIQLGLSLEAVADEG